MPNDDATNDPAALFRQAFASHQGGDFAGAARGYAKVLERAPDHFDALQLSGVLHFQQGNAEQALRLLDQALLLRRDNAATHANRGLALKALGRGDDAIAAFKTALALDPGQRNAQVNLAAALLDGKRFAEALTAVEQALGGASQLPELHFLHGLALFELDRPDAALGAFARALELDPQHVDARFYRGAVLFAQGNFRAAADAFRWVVKARPDDPAALNNLASALEESGQHAEALAAYDRILARHGELPGLRRNRATVLLSLGRAAEALEDCRRALLREPKAAKILLATSTALLQLERPEEALAACDEALVHEPAYVNALTNRGKALAQLRRYGEAHDAYAKARALAPGDAEIDWNDSLALLALGRYEEGWPCHEARYKVASLGLKARAFRQPLWNGSADLRGKTILLYAEQGFGDTLQFIRYARSLASLGAKVVIEVQGALKSLSARSFPHCQVLAHGEPLPAFDLHCPLLSLPAALRTSLATIPAAVPYLEADPERQARWGEYLSPPEKRPRIGIAWAGNPEHYNDRNRSLRSEFMTPLLADERYQFVVLQKTLADADRGLIARYPNVRVPGETLADFADTAALMTHLDLVISVDTSVLHLAGALGIPTWAMLPFNAEWRWLIERSDSPWYPTMRLYRQPQAGDWPAVAARIGADLRAFFAAGASL